MDLKRSEISNFSSTDWTGKGREGVRLSPVSNKLNNVKEGKEKKNKIKHEFKNIPATKPAALPNRRPSWWP